MNGTRPLSATVPTGDEPLADDASVDLSAERAVAGVDALLDALEGELIGLAGVKARIRELAALLLVDRVRARFGLSAEPPSLHMCFTGNPGTGKTTVALRMAELLHRLGYLRLNQVVSVTRDDLVGQYVGHTAPKTREVLKRALGGVLFIDEAYYLYRAENERDYGQETIEILLQFMENHRDDLVVILAGYHDRMETFFASNPGMSSRIAHHLEFPDYTLDELAAIADLMLVKQRYVLSDEAAVVFREYLARRMSQPRFANARSVRNALERARLRHAARLVAGDGLLRMDDFMRLDPADFLSSRVFNAPAHLRLLANEFQRQPGHDKGCEKDRQEPLPGTSEGDDLFLGGVEGFSAARVSSIANLQGVTSRLDRYLDRAVHFDRPGPLTVDHDIVRAATDLRSDCLMRHLQRCRHWLISPTRLP
jgi:probable Rubsico expression protein CbbX